jgi:hypothetical protein
MIVGGVIVWIIQRRAMNAYGPSLEGASASCPEPPTLVPRSVTDAATFGGHTLEITAAKRMWVCDSEVGYEEFPFPLANVRRIAIRAYKSTDETPNSVELGTRRLLTDMGEGFSSWEEENAMDTL